MENDVLWTYGYADNPEFQRQVEEQLPPDFSQYDLEMFFFLNYVPNKKRRHNGFPTDVPRDEHWWRASQMRWPTKVDPEDGRPVGQMIRDAWSEKIIWAIANYDTVNLMGGAGQGKTKTFMAFGITVWDYFYHTQEGARFQFSSVSERKINDACWAYTRQLYLESNRECSPNICKGQHFDGSMEIKRNRKLHTGTLQAIIRGVLITNDKNGETRIDSLTGAHEPHAQILVTDEAQSSPDSLSRAGKNLRTHADWFWELRSGNPASSDDYLGQSAKPDGGWDKVDPIKNPDAPTEWVKRDGGKIAYVIRFDNDNSPGMEDPERYWYRPTQAYRDREYPTAQDRQRAEYYRMWKGWFVPGFVDDVVIPWALIEAMGCHLWPTVNPRGEIKNFMSFDSAPESLDRSPLGHFQILYEDHKRVLNIAEVYLLPKLNPDTYDRDAAKAIIEKAIQWKVKSGDLTLDWTNRSGPKSLLQEMGFLAHGVDYKDPASKYPIDPRNPRPASDTYFNKIAEAAFLLEAFIRYGQVRGLNDSIIGGRGVKEEICTRRTVENIQNRKTQLEPKRGANGFRKRMGFSPDIFDILCQAALFARDRFGLIPGEVDRKIKLADNNKQTIRPKGGWNRRYL